MILLLVAWTTLAQAEIKVNDKLKLETVEQSAQSATYRNNEFEVQIKTVQLPSETIAKQKAQTEFNNIQNLYKPRGNPYQGQVSDLVQCGKELLPKTQEITVSGQKTTLLTGGASERKLFGACAKAELSYWGGYFQIFRAPATAMEVRVFLKKSAATDLSAANTKLVKFSQELIP